nr:hypothetical protein CFP56_71195 [Quercus suber]
MDQEVVNSLGNLKLTKEEEEDIVIANSISSGIFEECSLSLFGRLLSDRHQNLRALKNTLKAAWKMGFDLRIVEIWGLPFENMTEDIGRDIGSKIGRVLEVDKRAIQADQAKFLRIRVEVQIDKPLRRGGYVKNDEGGRFWVDFRQYGEWMKAGGVLKVGGEKEKLKEQSMTEKGGSASMVVDGEDRTENGVGGRSSSVLVVDGGVEPARGSVRWEERLPEASNSEKEQNAREGLYGDRTNSVRTEWNGIEVGQHVVSKEFGLDMSGAGNLSPIKIKETEYLRGEKKNGPELNENEGLKPIVQAQPH